MKHLSRALLPLLAIGLLVIAACSKPSGRGTTETSAPEGPVPPPVSSAPVETTPPEDQSEKTAKQAAPVPSQKPPVRKQQKTTAPPAVAENATPTVVPAPSPAPTPVPPPTLPPPVVEAPAPAPANENLPVAVVPAARRVTIPANATIAVRTIDSVDSRTDQAGQTFRASIDSNVIVDGEIIVQRATDAYLKLIQVTSAGELRGKSELQLQLERIVIGEKSYTIESSVVERSAAPEGPRTARDIGIGAAIGAAIGAIAGGGKGAAIGAGAGAGAGAAVAAITKGEQVLVPSETRLEFRLERPLEVELLIPSSPAPQTQFSSGPRKLGAGSSAPSNAKETDRRNVSDLSGEWQLSIKGPGRTRTLKLWLEQNGNNLKGRITDTFRDETALRGRVEGNSITFTTESRIRDRTVQSKYTGRVADDHLRGTLTMRIIGGRLGRGGRGRNEQSLDWSAERVQP